MPPAASAAAKSEKKKSAAAKRSKKPKDEEDSGGEEELSRAQKASLSEAELLDLKKERRRKSNREAAQTSRLRKKQYLNELEQKISELVAQNTALTSTVQQLQRANQQLMLQHRLTSPSTGVQPQPLSERSELPQPQSTIQRLQQELQPDSETQQPSQSDQQRSRKRQRPLPPQPLPPQPQLQPQFQLQPSQQPKRLPDQQTQQQPTLQQLRQQPKQPTSPLPQLPVSPSRFPPIQSSSPLNSMIRIKYETPHIIQEQPQQLKQEQQQEMNAAGSSRIGSNINAADQSVDSAPFIISSMTNNVEFKHDSAVVVQSSPQWMNSARSLCPLMMIRAFLPLASGLALPTQCCSVLCYLLLAMLSARQLCLLPPTTCPATAGIWSELSPLTPASPATWSWTGEWGPASSPPAQQHLHQPLPLASSTASSYEQAALLILLLLYFNNSRASRHSCDSLVDKPLSVCM
jgi:hypothetical protein